MPESDGFSMDNSWMEELPPRLRETGHQLLEGFTTASLWIKGALEREEEDTVHLQSLLLLGVSNMLTEGSIRIAVIESARAGEVAGIRPEILEAVQRSMFASLLLSGIRYGQEHPEAFLEYQPADFARLIEELIEDAKKGGEAGDDDDTPITDE